MVIPAGGPQAAALARACDPVGRTLALCAGTLRRFVLGATSGGGVPEPEGGGAGVRVGLPPHHEQHSSGGASNGSSATPRSSTLTALGLGGSMPPASQEPHVVQLVVGRTGDGTPVLMASPQSEYASFATLMGGVLRALRGPAVDEATFRAHLPTLFPLLTTAIRTEYAPHEVQVALADLFAQRIGPLVGAPAPQEGAGLGRFSPSPSPHGSGSLTSMGSLGR